MGCSGCLLLAWQDHRGQLAQRVPMVRLAPTRLCPARLALKVRKDRLALKAPLALLALMVRLARLAPTLLCLALPVLMALLALLAQKAYKAPLALLARLALTLLCLALRVRKAPPVQQALTQLCPVRKARLGRTERKAQQARLALMVHQEHLALMALKALLAQRQFQLMQATSPRLALMA